VRVKYREIVADNLSKAGCSWGWVTAIDSNGRTIWILDAHRDDERRFVVRADEKLTALQKDKQAMKVSVVLVQQEPGKQNKEGFHERYLTKEAVDLIVRDPEGTFSIHLLKGD
jgi:hypothetical protein